MPQPLGLNTPLNAASVSLADYPTGLNKVIFDIDPAVYSPFKVPIRGSSIKVLDGTVVRQVFGLQPQDFVIELRGQITAYATMQALWTKYRQSGTGQTFIWTDWFPNQFQVLFVPGVNSFEPTPIQGSPDSFDYTMSFTVISVIEWFGGAY